MISVQNACTLHRAISAATL